jgi:hypothetical protein
VTLVEFLLARLDEDEAAARASTPGPWRYNPQKEWHTDLDALRAARAGLPQAGGEEFVGAGPITATVGVAATGPADHPQSIADAAHIARHDPARVLAEVAAKRLILEYAPPKAHGTFDDGWRRGQMAFHAHTLRLLALPYAGHPDWREEWKS